MAALAFFSLAAGFSQTPASGCHATLPEAVKQVPWAGNAGEIQWSADQPNCKVDSGGLPWISISVLPPGTGNPNQRVLRYAVDTNFSPEKREGKIQVGDSTVTVEQAGGPAPGMAFTPGVLEFKITTGGNSLEATKPLYVGSEAPLLYAATADTKTPWLKVKEEGANTPQMHRAFQIVVNAAGLPPGVYQSSIRIDAPGASNDKEIVPVTLTVEEKK
jgi:hypothetical protein